MCTGQYSKKTILMISCDDKTKRKRMITILATLATLCSVSSCHNEPGPYDGIVARGAKKITINSLTFDTLRVDAKYTSLSGQWHMKDSILCFVDEYAVGVKEYDLEGNFLGDHIRQGNGPDEVIAPSFISTFDKTTGDFVMEDSNCFIYRFSKDYKKLFTLDKAWFTALSQNFGNKGWSDLYNNPDPEVPEMYEYNFECARMQSVDSEVIMPVITEHVSYNGYDRRYNKGFWKDSYIFIRFRPEKIASSKVLFGHYPPIYSKRNIPAFSKYDFCADEKGVIVTFAADSRIFIMDYEGNIAGSFGFPEDGISGNYPATSSFEEYESKRKKMMEQYGFYDRLARCGDYIFRTCHLDKSAGTILQIYDGNYDLVGRVPVGDGFEVIGECNGTYYAYNSLDLDSEQFIIITFRI